MVPVIKLPDLMNATGLPLQTAERLLPVAETCVDSFAPTAPERIRDEGIIRLSAYLGATVGSGAHRSTVTTEEIGPHRTESRTDYFADYGGAMRRSGVESLLSAYRQRRAGAI